MNKFTIFLDRLLHNMQRQGQIGTQDLYLATWRSILTFSGKHTITLEEVFTKDFLHRYQQHLLERGCCYNTVSSYMRVLRAIRNKAEKIRLIRTDTDLFDKLYTSNERTRKRAISGDAILALNNVDLSTHPHLLMSRDLFMLSFHLQGISFIDLAHLRKADFKDGYITYHRRKTGSPIIVKVLPQTRELLERCLSKCADSSYLFCILDPDNDGAKKRYSSVLRKYNRHLKLLAEIVGIDGNLTSYVARHSWATVAYHIGVPVSVISRAMGHQTEEVTRIYLTEFNTETLAYANNMVWKTLFEGKLDKIHEKKLKKRQQEEWINDVFLLAREGHEHVANLGIS